MNLMGHQQRLGTRLLKLSRSANVMLVLSGLLQRGFGFLVSLVLARQVGLDAVGMYTSLQISSSSVTSPLSVPLANSATLVSTDHKGQVSLMALMSAHLPALAVTGLLAALGSGSLMLWSASQTAAWQQWPVWLPILFVSLLSVATLAGQMMAGLFHGADKSLSLAHVTMVCTALGILACWPVATYGGITGALCLATGVVALPSLLLVGLVLPEKNTGSATNRELRRAVASGVRLALPNVASTLIHNAVNWYCCIYLIQHSHGASGVGLVTIGLQWMMLMQLPTMAWGGRMVADMGAAQQQSPEDLRQMTRHWLRKCAWSTALIGVGVSGASTLIAHLYRLQETPLPWVLMANAVGSLLLACTFVLERTFFCQGKQRAWLFLSLLGDAIQMTATVMLVKHSVLVASVGCICSALLILAGGQWMLRRLHPTHLFQS